MESDEMDVKVSDIEAEMGRAASLVGEVVDAREAGDRDSVRGNSDEDLLGAVEALEQAIRDWRHS